MKKRGLSLLLALCMLLSVFSALPITASAASSGQCGDNVYWTLDDNGTLTISGTGDMWDWSDWESSPWAKNRADIYKVIVKSGVTSIGSWSFSYFRNLTSVNMAEGCKKIGSGSFNGDSQLKSIYIPNGMTTMGNYVFNGCKNLVSIRFPAETERISSGEFWGCEQLTDITVDSNNPYLAGVDGNLYYKWNNKLTELVRYAPGKRDKSFSIPEGIKYLEWCAFEGAKNLTSVNIPKGVETICPGMFSRCSSLTSISIPDSVTRIWGLAFEDCISLRHVYYSGTSEQWKKIDIIEVDNEYLLSAVKHYNSNLNYTYPSKSTSLLPPSINYALITNGSTLYGLFSSPVNIEKDSNSEVSVLASVDFNGNSNTKVYLSQGAGKAVELKNGVWNTIQPGKVFSDGQDIYLLATDRTTGKSASLKTKLNIMPKETKDIPALNATNLKFKLGKSMGFTIPDEVPVLGGTELNWDIGALPVSVKYDKNDSNKIDIVFGSDGWDFDFDSYKKDIQKAARKQGRTLKQVRNDYRMKNECKANVLGGNLVAGGAGKVTPSVDIAGYAQMKYINGKWVFTEGQLGFEVEIMFSYQGQVFIWVVPCYYEIGAGCGMELDGKMINISPDGFSPVFDAYITAKVMAEIGGGIGIANVATVGAAGNAALNLKQSLSEDYSKVWADGSASIKVKVFGKTVAQKEFAKGSRLIYETGNPEGMISGINTGGGGTFRNRMLRAVKISETYPNESRSYAENPTVWQPQRPAMLRSAAIDYSNKELKKLASNVYTETKPMICNINGTKVMVMQWDSAQRADIDRTMLVYSVYDEDTGSWSEPTAVDDDGTADFYPCFKDGYLVWQNSKTLLSDDMTLEDIAKTGEICIAKWNGNGFDKTEVLTDNEALDTLPTVCANGDTVNAAWITNSSNDILGITGRNTIMQKTCTNGEWSETSEIKADLNSVISLSSGYANNKYLIAYVEDGDNDFDTMSDRNIIVIADGAETNITDNGTLNSNPVFADNRIYYYSAGNIVSANIDGSDKQNIFKEEKQGLTDNFVVDTNSNGDKAVWWTKAQSGAAEVYSALYRDNEWSDEINITSLGNTAKYPSGILNNDGTMLVAFTGGITENNEIMRTDLYTVSVAPSYDLEMTDAYIDEETMTVHATVKNSGELAVNSYTVSLDDGGTNNSVAVTEALPAGGTKEVEIAYNKPTGFTKRTITAAVSADNTEEYNLNNNSAEISVGLSDVSIVSVDSYEKLPSSSAVVAIENKGNCDAENVILSLRKETEDGEAVNEMNIGTLAPGEEKSVTIDYEPLKHENVLWYVTVQTDSAEITTANNAEYFVNESTVNLVETEHKILNYSINNTTLSVNTFVKNNTGTQLVGNVYAAVYNSQNELVGVAVQPINISGYGDTGVDVWINNYTKHDGDYIKAFIWDEKQTPKCGVDIQNIQ